jgi:hypothetical protein
MRASLIVQINNQSNFFEQGANLNSIEAGMKFQLRKNKVKNMN